MSHQIRFLNTENDWSNGLPLGNGCFGAMGIYNEGVLSFPMNHYEVYYNTSKNPRPAEKVGALDWNIEDPGKERRETRARADFNQPPKGEKSFWYYRGRRGAYAGGAGGTISASHPVTGEIAFQLPASIRRQRTDFVLDIEAATLTFTAKGFSVKTVFRYGFPLHWRRD